MLGIGPRVPFEDMDTKRVALDLARVAASAPPDADLSALASIAQDGGGSVVALLVSGTVMVGRLTSDVEMAHEIDRHIAKLLSLSEAQRKGSEPTRYEGLGTAATDAAERLHRSRQETLGRYADAAAGKESPPKVHELPIDLAREIVADDSNPVLTLADVHIFPPGGAGEIEAPVVRVDARQVGAWWIVQMDDEGSAQFTYPRRA